jgi:hypothetical protein
MREKIRGGREAAPAHRCGSRPFVFTLPLTSLVGVLHERFDSWMFTLDAQPVRQVPHLPSTQLLLKEVIQRLLLSFPPEP